MAMLKLQVDRRIFSPAAEFFLTTNIDRASATETYILKEVIS
jgi:hypothetical protein